LLVRIQPGEHNLTGLSACIPSACIPSAWAVALLGDSTTVLQVVRQAPFCRRYSLLECKPAPVGGCRRS